MPLPQPVTDILNSFSIVTPASGTQVPAGTPLTPLLNVTDPQAAFDLLLQPEVLAALDLDINLTDISLSVSPGTGAANLDVVLKSVEFPEPVETLASNVPVTSPASGKLPHLTPTAGGVGGFTLGISNRVQGLLGTAEGTIEQVEGIAGSIVGTITGSIVRTLLSAAPAVTVAWQVQDASGRDLTATEVVNLGTNAVPIYVLLPPFIEFNGGPLTTTERRLSCTITVTVGADRASRTVGPVSIQMAEVQVPTVLVMTEHAVGDPRAPGRILLAVPQSSVIDQNTDIDSIIAPLATVLTTVGAVLPASPAFLAFTAAAAVIGRLRGLLSRTFFVKADSASGLSFGFLGLGGSFEDIASSLVLIGPPGRRVRLYNARQDFWTGNFVERAGSVNVLLGPTGTVDIADFTTGMPPTAVPTGAGALDSPVTLGTAGTPALTDFNDVLSAYKFLAPQEL